MRVPAFVVLLCTMSCAHERHMPPMQPGVQIAPSAVSVAPLVERPASLDPWEPSVLYPALAAAVPKVRAVQSVLADGPLRAAAGLWFEAYQATFSRMDGSTCRFRPTCSGFGLQAVQDHGLLGLPIAFGRLHRSHSGQQYPMTDPPFLADPLANYTFTQRRPRLDDFAAYDDPAHAWYQHVRATRRLR